MLIQYKCREFVKSDLLTQVISIIHDGVDHTYLITNIINFLVSEFLIQIFNKLFLQVKIIYSFASLALDNTSISMCYRSLQLIFIELLKKTGTITPNRSFTSFASFTVTFHPFYLSFVLRILTRCSLGLISPVLPKISTMPWANHHTLHLLFSWAKIACMHQNKFFLR